VIVKKNNFKKRPEKPKSTVLTHKPGHEIRINSYKVNQNKLRSLIFNLLKWWRMKLKKINHKKEQKKPRSIRLTHKTRDLSHKTEITLKKINQNKL